MSVINILSPQLADMIAAGEVVERPASVIKELMENSIDACAGSITVEIKNGGSTFIRVIDNGCGMSPDDAGLAFTRHATSKLSSAKGLESIATMGFRGEALAAISSVSRIVLTTCLRGSSEGCLVEVEGGEITDMKLAGCPEGTTITVSNLFYNTPARLKFLKSDRAEAQACVAAGMRCALGRPDIQVRFIKDGVEEFFSPGDGDISSCIYNVLGRDYHNSLLECSGTSDGISVNGFVSSPREGRGNRSGQYFYCNGRHIKSQLLQAAVEQAYKNTLLTGRFPACVLYLTLDCGSVDVNVHPAKTEVKFSEEKKVYDAVYYAVLSALGSESRVFEDIPAAKERSASYSAPKSRDFYRHMSTQAFRAANELYAPKKPSGESAQYSIKPSPMPVSKPDSLPVPAAREEEKPFVPAPLERSWRFIGEAMHTYIIIEKDEELILIDKHAAHERMNFDALKARGGEIMSQLLLTPVTLKLRGEEADILESNAELIASCGFEAEPFGEEEYIIRAVPEDIDASDAENALKEIIGKISSFGLSDPAALKDELLHTVACKAAIKAGWDSSRAELERIADKVVSGEIQYCPHGRPVSTVISRRDLDKMFKRIV